MVLGFPNPRLRIFAFRLVPKLQVLCGIERHNADVLGDDVAVEELRGRLVAVVSGTEDVRRRGRTVCVVREGNAVNAVLHVELSCWSALQQHT